MKRIALFIACIAILMSCSQKENSTMVEHEQSDMAETGVFKRLIHWVVSKTIGVKSISSNPYLCLIIDADESDVIADELFRVGMAYHDGKYWLPKDLDKATYYFRKAAEKGHAVGQLRAATTYMRQYDDHNDMVLYWLQKAAEQGEPQAMHNLAISYHRGDINGQIDIEKSNAFFRRAAEKGYCSSCSRLAIIYRDGSDGNERSNARAKFWALESYLNNEDDDDEIVKQFFSESDFVDGQINTTKIYDDAAAAGEPHAIYKIGNAYAEIDIAKAVELWTKAADNGSLYAKCNLAFYYRNEKQDYETSNKLLEEVAKYGIEEAQYTLAESYYYGLGVEKDVAKAWEWDEKALNLGYTPAKYLLAVMSLRNELSDILPDKVYRGYSYMEQAAKDNYPPAIESSQPSE